MFTSLSTMKAMLTFQRCSLKMFPGHGEHTKMTGGEVEVSEPQAGHGNGKGKKEMNWKNEERELPMMYLVRGQSLFVGCSS